MKYEAEMEVVLDNVEVAKAAIEEVSIRVQDLEELSDETYHELDELLIRARVYLDKIE